MKVYVLIIDSAYDFANEINLEVWNTLGAAQESMFGAFQCAEDNGELDGLTEVYENDTHIIYEEQGHYNRNHWKCVIYEREVLIDKEEE